jgi:hypothetical protein
VVSYIRGVPKDADKDKTFKSRNKRNNEFILEERKNIVAISISNQRVTGMHTKDIDIYSKSSSKIISISER